MEKENITISVENYGPIAKAENIELCPLTVFVGPSNTGKSYLAILIYALLRSLSSHQFITYPAGRMRTRRIGYSDSFNQQFMDNLTTFLAERSEQDLEKIKFLDLPDDMQKWIKDEISHRFMQSFREELSRCIGTSTREDSLITDDTLITDGFSLSYRGRKKELRLSTLNNGSNLKINHAVSLENVFERVFKKIFRFIKFSKEIRKNFPKIIASEFINGMMEVINDEANVDLCYLPAARTGIMQSYRAIMGSLVRRTPLTGSETGPGPILIGIVSDFLHGIISMDATRNKNNQVVKVADKMEERILHGSIKVEKSEINQYPQFFYNQGGLTVPMLRSSSMVSELAPIVLFIRHRTKEGDLLIIEEPEAHLHPAAQRQMAEIVVDLINAGVRVMVTTHSDYFLEQLSNHVRLSKIAEADRKNKPALSEKDIAAYVFTSENQQGTVVKRLDFDKENGLSPEDHDKVSSDLYNETVQILDKIEAER